MDSQGFRKMGNPNYYSSYKNVKVSPEKFATLPSDIAPDNRYPTWPAIMADGRLATDYTDHCSKNIPVGSQLPTTQWLQRNGQKVIEFSRKNQFPLTRNLDISVIPPPAQILKTTKYDSHLEATNQMSGIGVERDNNTTPELFGTFSEVTFEKKPETYMETHYYEGGRNTPRGTYSNLTSVYHLKKKDDYY
jgi:hypothetical protein